MDGRPFGRYRLVELLGRGGMGEVWRAHDTVIDRTVAIKMLLPHFAQDKTFEQRFRREARAAARLEDPHVVPIYDVGEIDGRLYVAMRLINGHDLQTLLNTGPLEPVRSLRITEQIASALDAAHKAGLVHRDVKPSNILVTDDDFAYLIDFGIARAAGETGITSTGATIGTWAYMAPERFSSGEVEPSSDIYALTCVLYQSLTGELPFPGKTMEQVAMAHMTAPPPKPSTNRRAIPMAMDGVIATGLAKEPSQRYPAGKDLANAARAALNQAQAHTVAAPASGRPAAKSTANESGRWLVSGAAVAIVLLAAVMALVWRPWQREGGYGPSAARPSTSPVASTPAAPSQPLSSAASSPPSTTTMAALPAYLPPNSGCPGHVTAHHDIDHKGLGPVRIFLTVGPSRSVSGACIAAITAGGAALPAITLDADTTSSAGPFGFANPATDSTGNTFITYNAGGAHGYNAVLVLIPTAGGFEDIGWSSTTHYVGQHAYLDAELLGPGADGRYAIRQWTNDCTPSCAEGTTTTKDLRWNGFDYLP